MAKKTVAETTEVLERFDPSGDWVSDGDPRHDLEMNYPDDKHVVWVHKSDNRDLDATREYRSKGFREVKHGDEGYSFKSGLDESTGETFEYRDHVLMQIDKDTYERREAMARAPKEKFRNEFLKKSLRQDAVHVGYK